MFRNHRPSALELQGRYDHLSEELALVHAVQDDAYDQGDDLTLSIMLEREELLHATEPELGLLDRCHQTAKTIRTLQKYAVATPPITTPIAFFYLAKL